MKMKKDNLIGHICALITIFIWGTTFISTKVLLNSFNPAEILFFRFLIGLISLFAIHPKRLKGTTPKQELTFALAGLSGITLYYLLENIALTYTTASNVGVIVSVAPFFTAILSFLISKKKEKLSLLFFIGFLTAMAGIYLISFKNAKVQLNPKGDLLALTASFVWAIYSLLTKKIDSFGFSAVLTTRRIFIYGILFMIPALVFFNIKIDITQFMNIRNILNLIFLGICASAICFVTWSIAVGRLGAVKTGVYIYLVPIITAVTAFLFLKEPITPVTAIGTFLILSGLLLSQIRPNHKNDK